MPFYMVHYYRWPAAGLRITPEMCSLTEMESCKVTVMESCRGNQHASILLRIAEKLIFMFCFNKLGIQIRGFVFDFCC